MASVLVVAVAEGIEEVVVVVLLVVVAEEEAAAAVAAALFRGRRLGLSFGSYSTHGCFKA